MSGAPGLCAILVAGPCRDRAQRVLSSLVRQTVADRIEIVVVDLADEGTPRLSHPGAAPVTYVSRPGLAHWSWARAQAVRLARAPVVAFIEDHCHPMPDWAERLIAAHEGPWAVVGYGFTNADSSSYMRRASMLHDYSHWMHPTAAGPAELLPCHNVSYKTAVLLEFGERLEPLLTPDFNVQKAIREKGLPAYVESRALAAHENLSGLGEQMRIHFAFARLLAGRRARLESWSALRRLGYGVAVLPGAPAIAAWRLLRSVRGRPWLIGPLLLSLPVQAATRLWAAVGESLGYLAGEGTAERDLQYWELARERGA